MGRGGKLKIESLQNQQLRLVGAKVGRFLGMVMYDNEFETKETIKLNHNLRQFQYREVGGGGEGAQVIIMSLSQKKIDLF